MKKLLLLGASGSIGTQCLDLIRDSKEYELTALAFGHRNEMIEPLLREFPSVTHISLLDTKAAASLKKKFPKIRFFHGENGAYALSKKADYDTAVNAIVGFAGFKPTLGVLRRGKVLLLANKESLVVGGRLVDSYLEKYGGRIYPIDSEHAAIAKCLSLVKPEEVEEVILTASGGPFRNLSREELDGVTVEMALAHPTWKMGKKITIDSATLTNKAFEIIEACYLFRLPPEKIHVVIHPESLVHSGLKLKDGSYIVDYGKPDMHGPIAYALSFGKRIEGIKRVDSLDELEGCHFYEADEKRFPMLALGKKVYELGGTAGALMNGANEMGVNLFLEGKIAFPCIEKGTEAVISLYREGNPSYHFLAKANHRAGKTVLRRFVSSK